MGIVSKGAKCDIDGCDNDAVRSLNTKKVMDAGLRVNSSGKKSAICKEHYKEWKKATKDDRSLERARYERG
tara:strand:+ start:232 stop:444 length:213 start_codon:yes stop_codon:yes gene_type:complete